MFPRRRVVAACLALVLLGLSALYLHVSSLGPRDLAISDVGGDDVGTLVRVEGWVHRLWTTYQGNVGLVLLDYEDLATLTAIARPEALANVTSTSPGARVRVTGEVMGSSGFVQLFSDRPGQVELLQPASVNLRPLAFVAENAALLEGQTVVVRAVLIEVRAVRDRNHALLRDGGTDLWAYSRDGWPEAVTTLTGRLLVSSDRRCTFFVAAEQSPSNATIPELAGCPEHLRDVPLRIEPASVEVGELLGTSMLLQDLGDGAEYRMAAFVDGWDAEGDPSAPRPGDVVEVTGVVTYRATEARWQLRATAPPR